MPSFDISIYILIGIIILSIIISIVTWIFLTKTSSQLNLLEREVEKRSSEFDSFKKELLQQLPPPPATATVIESNDPLPDSPSPTVSNEDTIQIFRNVRGTFEHSEQPTTPSYKEPDPIPNSVPDKDTPQNLIAKPAVDLSSLTAVLKLYSTQTKDADFQALWKKLSLILKSSVHPHLAIDFSDIHFLYEKEMEYLEKINYLIQQQGGTLILIHCEKEVLQFLNRKQHHFSILTL